MVKKICISLRDYVYEKIFLKNSDLSEINKSARIEELIDKGLTAELKEKSSCQHDNKE